MHKSISRERRRRRANTAPVRSMEPIDNWSELFVLLLSNERKASAKQLFGESIEPPLWAALRKPEVEHGEGAKEILCTMIYVFRFSRNKHLISRC